MDIDEAFGHTFDTLFGRGEPARLDDFKDYLLQYSIPVTRRKSALSGKSVTLVSNDYCEGANFISQEEMKELSKPFSINEVKDIDGILEAIADRSLYTGNKTLGNSSFIKDSDVCMDSFQVRGSTNAQQSKYIGYSWMIRDNSEFVFGSGVMGKARYILRTVAAYNIARCFESYYLTDSTDCYFSYGCYGCAQTMFSFNQRGSRYVLGNSKLDKEKYLALKDKLLAEVREKLLKEKSFKPLLSVFQSPGKWEMPIINVSSKKDEQNPGRIDRAFRSATKIILGKEFGPLTGFEPWLCRHTTKVERKKTLFGNYTNSFTALYPFFKDIPDDRFVTDIEASELGKIAIKIEEDESFETLFKKIGKIAYCSPEAILGSRQNIIDSPIAVDSSNIYKIVDSTSSRNSGVSGPVLNSEYIFGSLRAINSRFCINCYHSLDLTNCFEMDSCSHCRDSLFCHNCENLDNCMFCFNVKGKRYAIGNVEIEKEQYARIKAIVLNQIAEQLEKTGDLGYDIYNIGCKVEKSA